MPRVTRSRRQANDILEDEAATIEIAQEGTAPEAAPAVGSRAPLSVIDGNSDEVPVTELHLRVGDPEEKTSNRGKKGRPNKGEKRKAATAGHVMADEAQVVEDGNSVAEAAAIAEACTKLMEPVTEARDVHTDNDASDTPPSPAAEAARQELSERSGSPVASDNEATRAEKRSHTVSPVGQHSPDQSDTVEAFPQYQEPAKTDDTKSEGGDSFVEHITARSPAKAIQRPEDSFQAMDDLEDAIEQVDKALTPVAKRSAANTIATKTKGGPKVNKKTTTVAKEGAPTTQKKPVIAPANSKTAPKRPIQTARPRPSAARERVTPRKASTKITAAPSTQPKGGKDVNNLNSTGKGASINAHSTKKQPRVSVNFPPPPRPIRSIKPPTRSHFELPGEAVSRRLKEQREERQKREHEELQKKPVFKAKPVPKAGAPIVAVRPTASSQARLARASLAGEGNAKSSAEKSAPTSTSTPRAAAQRQSSIHIAKRTQRPSISQGPSSTVTTARKPSLPTGSRKLSTGVQASTVTAAESLQQRQRGKGIFARDRIQKEERDQVKKAKEDAARRAREEAAERGRVASREWAEKQKRKLAAASSAKKGGDGQHETAQPKGQAAEVA